MRMLSKKRVMELVLYSSAHLQRLETDPKYASVGFPKRVRLGNGPRSRVGWLEQEILDWLQKRIDQRHTTTPH